MMPLAGQMLVDMSRPPLSPTRTDRRQPTSGPRRDRPRGAGRRARRRPDLPPRRGRATARRWCCRPATAATATPSTCTVPPARAACARADGPSLRHRDAPRRHRLRALGDQPLDELPQRRRARDHAAGRRPRGRSCTACEVAHRAPRARVVGPRAAAQHEGDGRRRRAGAGPRRGVGEDAQRPAGRRGLRRRGRHRLGRGPAAVHGLGKPEPDSPLPVPEHVLNR